MSKSVTQDSSIAQLRQYLDKNKKDHFNYDEQVDWQVSTGSLLFDLELGGGYRPGAYKLFGASFAGKSSCSALCLRNFLQTVPNSKGLWVKAEGRLDEEFIERSGVKFVFSPEEWEVGTCFVYESNVFESTTDLINDLVRNNPSEIRYHITIDSMDNLIRRDDLAKESEESAKVGAAGLLTSAMFKKVNLVLNKKGHALFMLCQHRAKIEVNKYAAKDKNVSVGGGGSNATTHNANQIWEFLPRNKGREIMSGDKMLGHKCAIRLTKGVKERIDITVEFPIQHGKKGGESVWETFEIYELLIQWSYLEKKGAWFNISDDLKEEMEANSILLDDSKFHGENKAIEFLENNSEVRKFLRDKFISLIND